MERGCLSYVVADPETKLAAIVDPEPEIAKPILGFAFKHSLKFGYVVDTHVHADHLSRARNLKTKPEPKLVMHEMASSIAVDSLESDFILDPEGVTDIICPKVWGMVRCKE